jgi:hypothetical protein
MQRFGYDGRRLRRTNAHERVVRAPRPPGRGDVPSGMRNIVGLQPVWWEAYLHLTLRPLVHGPQPGKTHD